MVAGMPTSLLNWSIAGKASRTSSWHRFCPQCLNDRDLTVFFTRKVFVAIMKLANKDAQECCTKRTMDGPCRGLSLPTFESPYRKCINLTPSLSSCLIATESRNERPMILDCFDVQHISHAHAPWWWSLRWRGSWHPFLAAAKLLGIPIIISLSTRLPEEYREIWPQTNFRMIFLSVIT